MRQLIRESYFLEYTGELCETERVEPNPLEEDEGINILMSFILVQKFQHDFAKFQKIVNFLGVVKRDDVTSEI